MVSGEADVRDAQLSSPAPLSIPRSLIMNESNFQHILRVLNTNLDGKIKVMFALTSIKGVGRRFSNVCCKKAEVDLNKRCAPPPHTAQQLRQEHLLNAHAASRGKSVYIAREGWEERLHV